MTPPLTVAIVPVTPFAQNCSVVRCTQTGRGCVIDPGGDLAQIEAAIDELNVEVESILITHGHLDHAGATAACKRAWGVPVVGPHREDAFWLEGLAMQGQMLGLEGGEPFVPDRWLDHGDQVQVGELSFEVLHCPGHTPGHVVFFCDAARLAFVGDVLFAGSIGRTDFPKGDHATLISSIQDRLFPLGDDVQFVPGHGPASTFGDERRTNPFLSGRFG